MPKPRHFAVQVTSTASPEQLYLLLADAPTWCSWAGPLIKRSEWEVEPGPSGIGGIRSLGRPPFMVREQIVEADPAHHHGYRMISGQPLRSYVANVHLVEVEGAAGQVAHTSIEWAGTMVALIPGTGWVMERLLRRMIAGFARRLAAAAEPT
jgi:hypothetical protein